MLMTILSCSTRKNNFSNRAYHTTTATYNVNFNGKEALKQGELDLEKKTVNNYTAILPVYYYPPKEEISAIFPVMDRVIEKSEKSISKHSMLIRGKEYNKTMDDVYLMMGKAYFHKQSYTQAQTIFNYMSHVYKGWSLQEESMIWNARTALRLKHYARAEELLNEIDAAIYKKKIKKLHLMYNAAAAE